MAVVVEVVVVVVVGLLRGDCSSSGSSGSSRSSSSGRGTRSSTTQQCQGHPYCCSASDHTQHHQTLHRPHCHRHLDSHHRHRRRTDNQQNAKKHNHNRHNNLCSYTSVPANSCHHDDRVACSPCIVNQFDARHLSHGGCEDGARRRLRCWGREDCTLALTRSNILGCLTPTESCGKPAEMPSSQC